MLFSTRGPGLSSVLALIVFSGTAFATMVPSLSFEQLTDQSEMVVAGDVVRTWSDWDSAHQFIWTHHEIAVSGAYKGSVAKTVVVSEPGGVVGDRAMSIAGTVSYAQGENVVVFLQRMPNGYLRTTGWAQGKYLVDKAGRIHGAGASGGLEIVAPDGPGQRAAAQAATPLRMLEGITAAQFRTRVEGRVRGATMRAGFALVLAFACCCRGDIRLFTSVVGDASPAPLFRTDNTAVRFLLNQSVAANLQSSLSGSSVTVISAGSNPVAAVRAAMATWNGVGTANIHFQPLQSTASGINADDETNVIAVATTADQLSALGGVRGALALTFNTYSPQNQVINGVPVNKGAIFDSDIVVNPSYAFSTDRSTPIDLQSVITHELGHALGANHTTLIGTLMYWRTSNQRFLSSDETTLVSTAYPAPGNPLGLETLTGTVTAGGQPVAYGMVSMIDPATGVSAGILTGGDGNYSVQVPAGSYQMLAEPLAGSIYLTAAQTAQAAAIAFQPTLGSGVVSVGVHSGTIANIAVTPGSSTLSAPLVAVAAVNGRVTSAVSGGPVVVQSGQSVDLVLAGAGYDASLNAENFQVFGPGIEVGAVRVDRNITFNGLPILRVTLAVAPSATQFLATVFITNGTAAYSLTGALVVTPPAPAFTSKSVVNAASYVGVGADGAVSPGGIYSLYAAPNTSNLGPATAVINGGFDPYGLLPTDLAGVSLTFDGVPAPLFFVAGGQINFQAPFELAGKQTTQVVVNYLGSTNSPVTVPVVATQPAFFTGTPQGNDSRAVNQDGVTLNTAQTPETAGNYVTIYGTGVGSLGTCANATGAGAPGGCTSAATVSIGGQPAAGAFFFAGWTPTSVGLSQWTVQIPGNAATGAQTVTATDAATGAVTPKGTIYVK